MSQNRPQGNKDSDLLFSALSRLELPTPEQVRLTRAATDIADPHAVDDLRELLNDRFFARIENAEGERTLLSKLNGRFKKLPEEQRTFRGNVFKNLETVLGCLPDRQEFFEGIATLESPTILGFFDQKLVVIDGGKDTPDKTTDTCYYTAWEESRRRSFVDEKGRKGIVLGPLADSKDDGNRTLSTRGLITQNEAKIARKVVPENYYSQDVYTFFDAGEEPDLVRPNNQFCHESSILIRLCDGQTAEYDKNEPNESGYLSAVRFTLNAEDIS